MKKVQPSSFTELRALVFVFLALVIVFFQLGVALAEEDSTAQIIEVRKKLQMSARDPILRDYYINVGANRGLKPGALIKVSRKTPLADPNRQENQSHIYLPVGVIKVIFVDRDVSIGRIQSISSSTENPVLDGESFMVGDRLDLGSAVYGSSAPQDKAAPAETTRREVRAPTPPVRQSTMLTRVPAEKAPDEEMPSPRPPQGLVGEKTSGAPQPPVDILSK